ncbi:MAG: hypothetical protein EOM80_13850 [Erysipelotrichia bacterium]|nr:hypothetical protein [Candidatus Riflebacteria bacterium]NCB39843.1 hypothetical protein [Erysipelotrichia bacterium]
MKQTLKAAFWISWYTFLEALRSRLLLGIFVLLIPLAASAWMLDFYQIGFQVKLVKDIGLSLMSLFGLLIVIFMSLEQIMPDLEKRSIYFLLTRCQDRRAYLIGRFAGVVSTLALFHGLMGFVLMLLLRWHDGAWFWEIPLGSLLLLLKQSVVVAIILMLAIVTTRIVVMSSAVLFYVLGHSQDIARMLLQRKQIPALNWLLEGITLLIPDFGLYEMRLTVIHDLPIHLGALGFLTFYTAMACMLYLTFGSWLLTRRDL